MTRFILSLLIFVFLTRPVFATNVCNSFYTQKKNLSGRVHDKIARIRTAIEFYNHNLFIQSLRPGMQREWIRRTLVSASAVMGMHAGVIDLPQNYQSTQENVSTAQVQNIERQLDQTIRNLDLLDRMLDEKGYYKDNRTSNN